MKLCSSCQLPKPDDQYSWNTPRCHSCRHIANKNNVADHRQKTAEIAANQVFSDLYRNWPVLT